MYSRMVAPADPVPLRGEEGQAGGGVQRLARWMNKAVLQGMWERPVLSGPDLHPPAAPHACSQQLPTPHSTL
jgi:hypothetical protein